MYGFLRELPDRDDGPDERQRRDDRVDARAVGQAGVDPRARLVDAPSERGDDPVDDPQDMLVVQEVRVDPQDLAAALDVDLVRPVDHDLGDRVVVEERFQRAQAGDVGDGVLDELQPFFPGDDVALAREDPIDQLLDHDVGFARRHVEQRVERPDHLGLEGEPRLVQELVPFRPARWTPTEPRSDDRDRDRHPVGPLLRPLDPLHQ